MHNTVNVLKVTKLYSVKWLVLYYLDFTSMKKGFREEHPKKRYMYV